MNKHAFEYDLKQLSAPPPDPAARERARRAAIEEFHRSRPPATLHARPSRWNPRSAVWSGLAAASVAVVGVAIYWLVPQSERNARLDRATVELAAPEPANLPAASPTAPPDENPPGQIKASPPAPKLEIARSASRAPVVEDSAPGSPAGNAITNVTERPELPAQLEPAAQLSPPAPPAPAAAPPPPSPVASPFSAEASRKLAVEQESLDEVSVTGSRRTSRLRGLFRRETREAPASIATVPENRDRFEHFEVNPVKLAATDPVSTFSADVDTASYSFVRRQLNDGVLPPADAVRVEEMVNYFDYAWPVPGSRDIPFQPTITVSDSPWGEGRKLVHIGIKGFEPPAGSRPDVNLVLLLDVSGSMNSPDKLPLAQRSMALLLDSLKPTDTVAIVVYAGAAGQVLAPTPVRDKQAILEALNSLRPGGSTAGAAGIQLAYELARRNLRRNGVNRILLATDGDFNVGISDSRALRSYVERERENGVFLSVLGFGQGNYRDEMAQALAQNGNGVAAYIDTLAEARKVLVEQAGAALFTIAKDVKLQVEFNPATVAEYRLVGYESRALNQEDFSNDKVDAGDVGAGHAVTAIYEITPAGSTARFVDAPRYGDSRETTARNERPGEYGFLKIRYKLPNGIRSRLIEAPIRIDAGVPEALEQDVEFSTAVAGFAQLLRGGRYTGALTYEDILRQAQASRGADEYGHRAEFVQLVRRAMQARGIP